MQLRDRFKRWERNYFKRFNIVFPILLAGWVPSILTLVVSYTILEKTLESKILRDRQTFIHLVAHLVGDDLGRTSGIIGENLERIQSSRPRSTMAQRNILFAAAY